MFSSPFFLKEEHFYDYLSGSPNYNALPNWVYSYKEFAQLNLLLKEQILIFRKPGWQKGGKYSYFPGQREILVIPGNYWEISYSLIKNY